MKLANIPFIAAIIFAGTTSGVTAQDKHDHDGMEGCPMHAEHAKGVDGRGDQAMGFSHEKTTHHFRLSQDGGSIEVTANSTGDETSLKEIRGHLTHISQMFAQGNFQIPMFVHDRVPPGVDIMELKKDKISYHFEEIDSGARVRITTNDPDALKAVHDFLRFQITDHRTGDSLKVANSSM